MGWGLRSSVHTTCGQFQQTLNMSLNNSGELSIEILSQGFGSWTPNNFCCNLSSDLILFLNLRKGESCKGEYASQQDLYQKFKNKYY